tara:strand:- start:516 stop:1856 length:1341 start_codon:yes stop_codon:yes gene_type:complete
MIKKTYNWQQKNILQQPDWGDPVLLSDILQQIHDYPNLVFVDEIMLLRKQLLYASQGEKFILQGGDCAETFNDFSEDTIKNKIKIILQMSAIIQYTTSLNVITIGRIAGQFAKPRSSDTEKRNGCVFPTYRGDAINDLEFDKKLRQANPKRLLRAYHQSAATMNLIRSLMMEGFTHFNNIKSWKLAFLDKSSNVKRYNNIAKKIKEALQFAQLGSINKSDLQNNFFVSHEALLLGYEEAFLNLSKIPNKYYNCSSHMLWIGDRTRNINDAHIEFASQLINPIGVKIGPGIDLEEIVPLCKKLNPNNELNKLILIIRLGAKTINNMLPKIIKKIKDNKLNVIWMCDPMHGNTIQLKNGIKTRDFNTIKQELENFFSIHNFESTVPAGVHFELTGEDVTECLGGVNKIKNSDLKQYYSTACDPRLNYEQSLEMAFLISNLLPKQENRE